MIELKSTDVGRIRVIGERGIYDVYRFFMKDGSQIEIQPNFSYEEIWTMYQNKGGNKEGAWGFKFKKSDDETNKSIMLMGLLLRATGNKWELGTGDATTDKALAHDWLVIELAKIVTMIKNKKKVKQDLLDTLYDKISNYKCTEFEQIITKA